jgi:hypothetical protein
MSTQGIPAEATDLERALGVAEYRKTAPVAAVQFRADPPGNGLDLARWCRGQYLFAVGSASALLTVPTLEGYEATARDGDWVCRGGAGEFWVVEQDRFAATHLPAGEVRVNSHYAVAIGTARPWAVYDDDYDDEKDARGHLGQHGRDAYVVRCTVTTTPWERVEEVTP